MGNSFSRTPTRSEVDTRISSESDTMAETNNLSDDINSDIIEDEFHETSEELATRSREEEMIEFKKQLEVKREQRREVIAKHRHEKETLKKSLEFERAAKASVEEENHMLRKLLKKHNITLPDNFESDKECNVDVATTVKQIQDEVDGLKENNNKLRRDLAEANLSLQTANSDIVNLSYLNVECTKQIGALKEVIRVCKTMINLREQQLIELKEKLTQIEQSLADRETSLLSTDLRQEYERQLQNIRTLRGLYEERARLAEVTRLNLLRELEEQKRINLEEVNRCKDLTSKVEELEEQVQEISESVQSKNDELSCIQDETRCLKAEMSTVNKLFSQVLLGYKSKQNWDQLVHRLEENHGLLTHMVERDDGSESSSALPKLLLEIVSQVDDDKNQETSTSYEDIDTDTVIDVQNEQETQNASAEEIVRNLPKVWKVLTELLSHQNSNETNSAEKITTCYKTVETSSGPVLVPSVSQTYIRLKDLIIEKLALIKEVNKMKQLNGHLETRLEEQERRLCLVTSELSKTWHVVGRLRRHHHQLHTHEKILKYELQQKRKLLNDLKDELEYCREKLEMAREKNTQSERDCRKLRAEFTNRKVKGSSPSFNNSAESGYSDERQSDESSESNDESECIIETSLRSRKKIITSFDNILDSSADFNLIAEREDPISDMIDVADLPLDSHESEEGVERPGTASTSIRMETDDISTSESDHSNIIKLDKNSEETEDESCDMADISPRDHNGLDTGTNLPEDHTEVATCSNLNICTDGTEPKSSIEARDTSPVVRIDPTAILESIRLQNERLKLRDEKFKRLEKESTSLLKKTQNTLSRSAEINNSLDHLLSTSGASDEIRPDKTAQSSIFIQEEQPAVSTNEPKLIHDNVRHSTKDETLGNLEEDLKEPAPVLTAVSSMPSTLNVSEQIEEKMNSGHEASQESNNENCAADAGALPIGLSVNNDKEDSNLGEPSTSTHDIDHEARFAARDLRLKLLEEETKSLVNKVNNTKTKRVKLHYKLEELHNIYGSENSRAGTPSEDTESDDNKGNEKNNNN